MIDINKPCEGIDYVIVPSDVTAGAWAARVLRGPFNEHVLFFTGVEFDGHANRLKFALNCWAGMPDNGQDPVIVDTTNVELQDFAFDVLSDIIRTGLANGSIVLDDKNTNDRAVG